MGKTCSSDWGSLLIDRGVWWWQQECNKSENGAKSLRKIKQTFMMITAPNGTTIKDGCESSMGGETDFVKPTSHNSRIMTPQPLGTENGSSWMVMGTRAWLLLWCNF